MIQRTFRKLSPLTIPARTFMVFLLPFLLTELFPVQLDRKMDISSYLVFHNTAEFFSIMVSLCVFSVGWFTYDQSKDRHALFLGTAFLAVGLIDFMHTLSNAAMPAFITPNSTNKSTQFWIAARMFDASAFLISAFIYPKTQNRWLSKRFLTTAALAVTGFLFVGVIFFESYLPATAIQGVGLTPLKRYAEYLVIILLIAAFASYWKRMVKTGDGTILHYLSAFIICIFSEAVFASYKTGFDTYNVVGHIYKILAFCLIYKAVFVTAVTNPYITLREYATKLEQSNRDLLDFSFIASHDLQEPLRKVQTFCDMARTRCGPSLDDAGKGYLERAFSSASRMRQLLHDLLQFSMVATDSEPLKEIDLGKVARKAACLFEEDLKKSGGLVEIESMPHIEADEDQMLRLLQNLIGNGLKYRGDESPRIKIFAKLDDQGRCEIFVKDNGIGFDQEFSERIFKPFQRLHGRKEYEGTGMGLALCRKIVERHGGSIWARSEPGEGSTFIIRLPVKQDRREGL